MGNTFNSVVAPRARRIAMVAAFVMHCANGSGTAGAADAPAPASEKLELITEFFDNEVATGKLPGAVILIQRHGRPDSAGLQRNWPTAKRRSAATEHTGRATLATKRLGCGSPSKPKDASV